MKIAMINGSPKVGKSNSGYMLQQLEPLLSPGNELFFYAISGKPLSDGQHGELCRMDALIFAFPLYIDAIPSQLFRMLIALSEHMKMERNEEIYVYAMINNGFFEGKQCRVALEILQNWCFRSGLHFGQGICQGAGEMMGSLEQIPFGHGPFNNLGTAMESFAKHIQSRGTEEPLLLSPNFPRFAWRFASTHTFWNAAAQKNGLKKKNILKRL